MATNTPDTECVVGGRHCPGPDALNDGEKRMPCPACFAAATKGGDD